MKKVVKITKSDKRVIKQDFLGRKGDLYSNINKLIDREFDDVETSDIIDVLTNILDNHKKHNIKDMSISLETLERFGILKDF